jgi:ribosomal protein S18 acetylase RimI-like enzyme
MTTLIRPAQPHEMPLVRELFLEYAHSLGFSLCFQGFDEELASLPGKYAPPEGLLLLAFVHDDPAGVVGLRPLEPGICEMKRLYVKDAFHGLKLGHQLADRLVDASRQLGYQKMRLDTLPNMEAARRLYHRMGFSVIPAYYDNTPCGSICMELQL